MVKDKGGQPRTTGMRFAAARESSSHILGPHSFLILPKLAPALVCDTLGGVRGGGLRLRVHDLDNQGRSYIRATGTGVPCLNPCQLHAPD